MNVSQIRTRKFNPPKDDLNDLLSFIPKLTTKSIVAISSKVISICEGKTVPVDAIDHDTLVAKLSSATLEPTRRGKNGMILTQVGGLLVESAGIDVSNANGHYVLLPSNPFRSARDVWKHLRKRDKIRHLGVVITDSHAVPRRKGAIGFALASYGFKSTYIYKNERDIFGKAFNFTATNVADSVAASAVLMMGEGSETTPVAVVTGINNVKFFTRLVPLQTARRYSWVHPDLDVYEPLLSSKLWSKSS